MVSEAVSNFVDHPTIQGLKSLKKDELLELAQHLTLENVKPSFKKHEIARKIAEYYVVRDVFSEDDLDQFPDPSAKKPLTDMEAKIKLMQLEIEKEKNNRIAEREAREAEREAREAREREREADRIAKKEAREAQLEQERLRLDAERQAREAQLYAEREARAVQEREREADRRAEIEKD